MSLKLSDAVSTGQGIREVDLKSGNNLHGGIRKKVDNFSVKMLQIKCGRLVIKIMVYK